MTRTGSFILAWCFLAALALASPQARAGDDVVEIGLDPSIRLKFVVDLSSVPKKRDREFEGSKALLRRRFEGVIIEPISFFGCTYVRKNARIELEVTDASAPQAGGRPAFIQFKVVAIQFSPDTEPRPWPRGGTECVVGTDKSDRGKILFLLPRKGGKIVVEDGTELEVGLLAGATPTGSCALVAAPKEGAASAGSPETASAGDEPALEFLSVPRDSCVANPS